MSTTQPPPGRPPLRVVLAVDGWQQPRWMHRLAAGIRDAPYSRIAAVVLLPAAAARPESPVRSLFERLDRRLLGDRPDACQPADLRAEFGACPAIELGDGRGATSAEQLGGELARLAGGRVDVLVALAELPSAALAGRLADAVWQYRHGAAGADATRAGFWETAERAAGTPTELEQLDPEGGRAAVLTRTLSPTDPLSPAQTRNHCLWKAPELVLRQLRLLHAGPATTPAAASQPTPDAGRRRPLVATARLAARQLGFRLSALARFDQWQLVCRWGADGEPPDAFAGGRQLVPPPGRSWADPFPVCRDGAYYLFFEDYCHRSRRAHIAVAPLAQSGFEAPPVVALRRDHHLSYPFVFEWQGDLYMLPESAANRRLELYRCERFPDRWAPAAILMEEVEAADATLFEDDNGWWLFAAIAVADTRNRDELHLFQAPTPLGPWRHHPANPVVSSARGARPAGRLFRRGGRLLRPGQDSSRRYGAAIILHEVVRLDGTAYEEVPHQRIEPDWLPGLVATHTLNHCRALTVGDAAVRRWRRPEWRTP